MVGAVVAALVMLTLLTWQLVVLKDSRRHIAAQDAKITRLMRGAEPALDEAEPALRRAGSALRDARPLIRDARNALGALDPAGLERAIDATGHLAGRVDAGNLLLLIARAAELAPYVAELQRETLATQRRSLDVQARTLRTQERALRVLLSSHRIQGEALAHIRSIDRKTGGQVPPAGAPVPSRPVAAGRASSRSGRRNS